MNTVTEGSSPIHTAGAGAFVARPVGELRLVSVTEAKARHTILYRSAE
jgi:hypothetical protein